MTHVLYWDIDGTLLSTARAGVPALEDGVEEVTGLRPSLTDMHTAGLTDRMIARQILVEMGHQPDDAMELAVLQAYARALPARLRQRRGTVLPGVRELLDALAHEGVVSTLLTGNIEAGARAKLESYGLLDYFEGGSFADDGFDRPAIARHAVDRASTQWGEAAARAGVLIGDTPLDVACGAEIGLRVLAVATGGYDLALLSRTGAWWVLDRLPGVTELVARIAGDPVTSAGDSGEQRRVGAPP